ncbi:MAG: Hpt domain-containing protein [Sinobacterium sp.]|nr:Hpt domain-containing protein [Sinobacterium sp.]
MSDLFAKLWPAFVSEVTEQLDSVELLLAKSSSEKIDINQLFRNFHTIKGNCSMIGFTSMETIAHRAEDILACVRNDDFELSEDVIDILLTAISCLKKQFQEASVNKENPELDEKLQKKLEQFIQHKLKKTESNEVSSQDKAAQIEALVGSAKLAVPSLILGLDENARTEAIEPGVQIMAKLASTSGFKALSRHLLHYLAFLGSNDKSQLLIAAANIFETLKFVCQEHQVDLSLELGSRLCHSKLENPWQLDLNAFKQLLKTLQSADKDEWQAEELLSLIRLSIKLDNYCSLFSYTALNASFRYIRQLVVELTRGYIHFNNDILDHISSIAELAQQHEESEAFDLACSDSLTDLQAATAKNNHGSDEVLTAKEAILAESSISMDALNDLQLSVLEDILEKIQAGSNALEVDLRFEDEELGEKVLTTCRHLGELAHSRTLFHDFINGVAQRTSFCLLLLTAKPTEDIDKILSIIDRERKVFNILGHNDTPQTSTPDSTTQEDSTAEPSDDVEAFDEAKETASLVNEAALSLGSLKVDGQSIDKLISSAGELITVHNRLSHIIQQDHVSKHLQLIKTRLEASGLSNDEDLQASLDFLNNYQHNIMSTNESLQSIINSTQEGILDLRVVPISYAFDRFHKFVRSIGQKLNKKVVLEVSGEQVKIDKGMIDILSEPLAHLVRNSIDHGIELPQDREACDKAPTGLIFMKAEQQHSTVIITISDDGKGLNKEKIYQKGLQQGLLNANTQYDDEAIYDCIFHPGFSTSETLTETSGRGVGMDVVKSKITAVGGSAKLSSTEGKGTTVTLKLPVSAAIQSVILLKNDQQTLAMPERFILEIINITQDDIQLIQGQSVLMLRDAIVPIFRLNSLIQGKQQQGLTDESFEVVILSDEKSIAGIVVDSTLGRAEVLVRDVHASLKNMVGVAGAAILGDGHVVIILDCDGLFSLAKQTTENILTVESNSTVT